VSVAISVWCPPDPTIASLRRDEVTRLLGPSRVPLLPSPVARATQGSVSVPAVWSRRCSMFQVDSASWLPGRMPRTSRYSAAVTRLISIRGRDHSTWAHGRHDQPPRNDPTVRPPSKCFSCVQGGFSGSTIRFEQGRIVLSDRAVEALAVSGADSPVQSGISFSLGTGYTLIGWTDD
jgi:hypothetical protein